PGGSGRGADRVEARVRAAPHRRSGVRRDQHVRGDAAEAVPRGEVGVRGAGSRAGAEPGPVLGYGAAMIDRTTIHDFKSIGHVELDLGRVTVVVGQNGAGKSSLLEALGALTVGDSDEPFAHDAASSATRLARREGTGQCDGYRIEALTG